MSSDCAPHATPTGSPSLRATTVTTTGQTGEQVGQGLSSYSRLAATSRRLAIAGDVAADLRTKRPDLPRGDRGSSRQDGHVTLLPSSDTSDAEWIVNSARPWVQLVCFGPEGFEAYARLRFLPDPAFKGMSEADAKPETELSEVAQLRIAVSLLARHTRTPHELCLAWWDGWGTQVADLPVTALEHSKFQVPERSYFLLRGSLADFELWSARAAQPVPAFIWPADRAWCLANDVDPHWAGIGATDAALEQLLTEPRLDVTLANPLQAQPTYA
jgi:hypothetical protein